MNIFHTLSSNLFKGLLQIVWPIHCPVCGKLCEAVCTDCLASLIDPTPRFCLVCGAGEPCAAHPRAPLCCAGTRYGGKAREVVHLMKYQNARKVAFAMGRVLACRFARPDADCLVPVPLHTMSERDYNQAELIAGGAAAEWGIPVKPLLAWSAGSVRQVEKENASGRILPKGAMSLKWADPAVANAFLIDDVYTTGATLRAAYETLMENDVAVTGAMLWSKAGG